MQEKLPDLTTPESPAPLVNTYTSVPISITAAQWDGTEAQAERIIDWMESHRGRGAACYIQEQPALEMGTHEGKPVLLRRPARIVIGLRTGGSTDLSAHDWLIRGVDDEFYPCPDAVFRIKYRPAYAAPSETLRFLNAAPHILIQNGEEVRG